jgi:hypothetical protein
MRALQFAQDRLATGGWQSTRRPILLTILMWFSAVGAIGGVVWIGAVAAGVGGTAMRGKPVSREEWLAIAAPVIGVVAMLMALTSIGLRRHRPWARWTWMSIWPFIVIATIAAAVEDAIPVSLAWQAVIAASVGGALFAWALFRYHASVLYFYRIRQARSGSMFRR